jgi:hypothetical protein
MLKKLQRFLALRKPLGFPGELVPLGIPGSNPGLGVYNQNQTCLIKIE